MLRRICLFALTALVGAALFALPASADVAPLKVTIPASYDSVTDGTDVYWIDIENGSSGDWILQRKSVVDGSSQRLARFRESVDGFFPDYLFAGGGYVFVGLYADGIESGKRDGTRTKIVRMARDGSGMTTVAEGTQPANGDEEIIVKGKKAFLNDCGTSVSVETASSTGAIVVQEVNADRESKPCGGKKNVNHVRYYALGIDGAQREIYRYDTPIRKRLKVRHGNAEGNRGAVKPGIGSVTLNGDYAAFSLGRDYRIFVRNLATGGFSGPFTTGLTGRFFFQVATVDSIGRVALNSIALTSLKRTAKLKYAAGLVRTPGDAASYVKLTSRGLLEFCGDHLVKGEGTQITEIDPVTLQTIRPIATLSRKLANNSEFSCSGGRIYIERFGGSRDTYWIYQLG